MVVGGGWWWVVVEEGLIMVNKCLRKKHKLVRKHEIKRPPVPLHPFFFNNFSNMFKVFPI